MANDVLMIHHHGRSVCSQVHQQAAAALLYRRQDSVGQGERCQIHLCYLHAGYVEAAVELLIVATALQDIEEITLQPAALYADRVQLGK